MKYLLLVMKIVPSYSQTAIETTKLENSLLNEEFTKFIAFSVRFTMLMCEILSQQIRC